MILRVNQEKDQVDSQARRERYGSIIVIRDYSFEMVKKLTCLGSVITNTHDIGEDVEDE